MFQLTRRHYDYTYIDIGITKSVTVTQHYMVVLRYYILTTRLATVYPQYVYVYVFVSVCLSVCLCVCVGDNESDFQRVAHVTGNGSDVVR